jgi:hypothetical protein
MSAFMEFADTLALKHNASAFYAQKLYEARQCIAESKANPPKCVDDNMLEDMYTEEDLVYMIKRKEEFCENLGFILQRRLQPNYSKRGGITNAGQCPFYIFDWWFGTVLKNTKRTHRVYKITCDGVPTPRRVFYYSWNNAVPDLGLDYRYYERDHKMLHGLSAVAVHSKYVQISLAIEEDTGRVSCLYDQVSVATQTGMIIA